ncbi:MAG: 30S ribosomal protein S16 [Candidatus Levybacteria bacterium RIFCSPHIGHO2_01_FULL_36_15]|nr:MAG: 30S ribosomal protein S16 [Candidatus Levybacteria bacterium RIFCSPHIGHO2_01_FULL_36_15]OGH39007.1 MAG: 30S ribosomal protein S16 [Candidatus Levybacteria bacterium RIFCSPLOWO2_01_FULL_36_10]
MALVIRFSKMGRRGERKFRIVVKEKRSKRDGKAIDTLGSYEKKDKNTVTKKLDEQKLKYWLSKGATPSESVKKIL